MKMTRLTSLILCLVFMICMFAGCSHTVKKAVTKTATDPFAKFYNFLNALEYLL